MMGLVIWTYNLESPDKISAEEQSELSQQIESAIQTQVESVIRHQQGVTFGKVNASVDDSHDDWEPGSSCPECGSREVCVANVTSEIYYSGGGEFEYVEPDNTFEKPVVVICEDCQVHLSASFDAKLKDSGE